MKDAFIRKVYLIIHFTSRSPIPKVNYSQNFDPTAVKTDDKINFPRITRAMHNKSLSCIGISSVGIREEIFTLKVEYPPIANMTMALLPFIRNTESAAHICCDVSSANPKPAVAFYFNGYPISTFASKYKQRIMLFECAQIIKVTTAMIKVYRFFKLADNF